MLRAFAPFHATSGRAVPALVTISQDSMHPAPHWYRTEAMPLADQYFLSGHLADGRPSLSMPSLTLGLAAALLCELIMHRKLSVHAERQEIAVADPSPLADAVLFDVLAEIEATPGIRSIGDWLAYLAHTSRPRVATRLLRANLIDEGNIGPRWKRTTVYPPRNINDIAAPQAILIGRAERSQELPLVSVLLGGLAAATGLEWVLRDLTSSGRAFLREYIDTLHPTLWTVIAETKRANGAATLGRRH